MSKLKVLGTESNNAIRCSHSMAATPAGLCLISIGNTLRGDDGIASKLCDALPEQSLSDVCCFDLGTHCEYLSECLQGHNAAIIVDCTKSGAAPGTVTVLDLLSVLENHSSLSKLVSSHGISFVDELRLINGQGVLPKRIVFFGVEAGDVEWSQHLSEDMNRTLPTLVNRLSVVISVILESLKKDA